MLKRLILFFSVIFLLVSCGDYTQDLRFNKDGGGTFVIDVDASEMIGLLEMMSQMETDSTKKKEPADFMASLFLGAEEILDTTISMYDAVPDSLRQELSHPEYAKDVFTYIKADKVKETLGVGIKINFSDLEDLGHKYDYLEELQKKNNGAGKQQMPEATNMISSKYFKENFHWKGKSLSVDNFELPKEEMEAYQSMPENERSMLEMMMKNMNFTQKYTFPGKIKEVKGDIKYTIEGESTLVMPLDLKSYMESGKLSGFEVIWE